MEKVMEPRRLLLMYATMTGNTEKVAGWFRETFEEYGWEVTFIKVSGSTDWAGLQDRLYFDDYDLVALGSPIVGGSPLQAVIRAFSFGAGGSLEKEVQNNLDAKKANAAAGAKKPQGACYRRTSAPAPGMADHSCRRPLGFVFTTYGGGFYGSDEAKPVLETLKMYLKLNSVDVIGMFSCGGKETGPAGYDLGVKPKSEFRPGGKNSGVPDADVCDPVLYRMGDGRLMPGSYFFHYDNNHKPQAREEQKARAFAADIIEDYFMTYDGRPNPPLSEILSIS